MLWLDMEVLEGPLKGRHVYDQLNLINPNPTAEEIAQRTLQRHLPCGRQAPGRGQRGAALPAPAGPGRGQAQRLQRGQGLQAGEAGRGGRHADPGGEWAGDARPPPSAADRRRARCRRTRPRPGRGALDPDEGSAVADRVWRHGGDGAFPTGIRRTSMEDGTLVPRAPAGKVDLPASRPACRAAIDQLRGEIDAIKAQIAAADLERQAKRGKMDPRWYHRARTAIRHKRQQIAALTAHLQTLPPDREGRVQGLPDRGPARRVRRRGVERLPRSGARAARPAGGRLMAPLPPRASPTVEAILAAYRGRRRRRLPRAPRRLGDRPGVRPGALVRVPLGHARRPGRPHAAPVRDRPARGGAADPQPAPDRRHRARRRSRDRPAVARAGARRALRRQSRWRRARHPRGAEDLARARVQDPQRAVVRRAQASTASARRSPSTGRRCRSTCI